MLLLQLFIIGIAVAAPSSELSSLDSRATQTLDSSCSGLSYFGFCRLEANCTTGGARLADTEGSALQHTYLNLAQCVQYDTRSETLRWRSKAVANRVDEFCAPCDDCNIDPDTTVMQCKCRYEDTSRNHDMTLRLSDHVFSENGVLGCLDTLGDPDADYKMLVTQAKVGI